MNLLKLDVDNHRTRLTHGEMVRRLAWAGYRLRWLRETRSPSGRGLHVVCRVTPLPVTAREVVALQLLLGSDPLREAHNLERARAVDEGKVSRFWCIRWNVLYGKPHKI